MAEARSSAAGLILAGGLATRLGGAAKGATLLKGRPLIAYVLENLSKDLDAVAVSTRPVHQGAYKGVNLPLLFDEPNFEGRGPLVGLLAGLEWAQRRRATALITAPCDAPFLPPDMAEKLLGALEPGVDAAFAATDVRDHPLCAAWRPSLAAILRPLVSDPAARRSVKRFLDQITAVKARFPDEAKFLNINTFEDLELAARQLP
ncbi:MAG: molybdenum cofactor guanylyltransferase [Caulobacterales bacterium]